MPPPFSIVRCFVRECVAVGAALERSLGGATVECTAAQLQLGGASVTSPWSRLRYGSSMLTLRLHPGDNVVIVHYVGLLVSVNCSATVAGHVADAFRRRPFSSDAGPLAEYPNVDGVVALTHRTGCGMAGDGEGMEVLRRTLGGYSRHPNFASVILLGLGCEANQVSRIAESEKLELGPRLHALTIQDSGGTARTVERGIALVRELLPEANRVRRQTLPASHLTVGLQCGGSDGYSGITANRRWARPRTSSCGAAGRSSCRRAPRPTGPSTS